MAFALLAFLATIQAQAFSGEIPGDFRPKLWTCHATDYQGAFGFATAPTRSEAQSRAISDCIARSRFGSCTITSCTVQ